MRKLNQSGSLLLPLIIMCFLFLGAAVFGAWAFMGRQDFKNNSDQKSAVAAKKAISVESARKDAVFSESLKSPVKSYTGPETYGSLKFDFPKTWNQYVSSSTAAMPVNLYFNPDYIPDLTSNYKYALRVQITNTPYNALLKPYDSKVKDGSVNVAAYKVTKVPSVLGSMLDGKIFSTSSGTLILLPLRDKTILFWTEDQNFKTDFINTVLPSITYSP